MMGYTGRFRPRGVGKFAVFDRRTAFKRELKQPRRQRQGKRHFKNDFQILQTCSRLFQLVQSV